MARHATLIPLCPLLLLCVLITLCAAPSTDYTTSPHATAHTRAHLILPIAIVATVHTPCAVPKGVVW